MNSVNSGVQNFEFMSENNKKDLLLLGDSRFDENKNKVLFASLIPLATGEFELGISCTRRSYLTHQSIRPNRLSGFGVPKFATLVEVSQHKSATPVAR